MLQVWWKGASFSGLSVEETVLAAQEEVHIPDAYHAFAGIT